MAGGTYLWEGVGTEPYLVGVGPVVPPPTPVNRVRVSRLKVTTTGTVDPPATNPRLSLVPGTYRPDLDQGGSIGVPVGPWNPAAIVPFQGDFTATSNGQIIENLEIFGRVNMRTFRGTIRNCIIWGNAYTTNGTETCCIFGSSDNLNGTIVEDCLIQGRGNVWCSGIRGGNFTVRRCEMRNLPDYVLFTSQLGNCTLEASWLHGGYFEEWPMSKAAVSQGGDGSHPYAGGYYTHVDGVQFHRGKNYDVNGNMIGGHRDPWDHHLNKAAELNAADDLYNASLLLKQEVNNGEANFIDNVKIRNNIFYGGASTLNITSPPGDAKSLWDLNALPADRASHGPKNYFTAQPAIYSDVDPTVMLRPARVGAQITNNQFVRSDWDNLLKTRLGNDGQIMDPNGQAYILRDPGLAIMSGYTFTDNGATVPIRAGKNNV